MTNRQENRLTMMLAVRAICSDLAAIFSLLPNFSDLVIELGNIIKHIQGLNEAQELDYKGKTDFKNSLITDLITKTMDIVRRVVAYATVNKLYELLEEVNYSESDLKRLADTQLRTVCQVINDRTTTVLASLNDYGVTQALLDDQALANTNYYKELTSPREGIIYRKIATTAMAEAFKESTKVLVVMDKLVETLKDSDPDSYLSYVNARIVVDYGKGKKKEEFFISGKTIDFDSGLPLGGVHVSIVGTTTVMMTEIDGLFNIKVSGPGEYMLQGERDNYRTLLEEVSLNGEPTDVVMEMEKAGEL